ncbi:hypothetical protein BGX20_000192 [Mortierella sp. AD010]|nr:hypothetical protein BGX20_000192 [Mortierella sp. AD010]
MSPPPHGYNYHPPNNPNSNYNPRSLTPNSISTPDSSPSSHSSSYMNYSNNYRHEFRSSWDDRDRHGIAEPERRRSMGRENQQQTSTQPRPTNKDNSAQRASSSSRAPTQGSKSAVSAKQAPSIPAPQQRAGDKEKKADSTLPRGANKGNTRAVSVPNEAERGDSKAIANKSKPTPFVFGEGGAPSFSFANVPPLKGPPTTQPTFQSPSKVMQNIAPKPVQPVPASIYSQQPHQQQLSLSNPSGTSPLIPQSMTSLKSQHPAGQLVVPSKTTEQASHVTYESNIKLIDMHIASLRRSLNSLEKTRVEAADAERSSVSQDLSGVLLLIQSEIQCYTVIRSQLHPTQDPQMQRKTISAAHDRILSANLGDISKILENLENITKLPVAQVSQPPSSASSVTHSGSIAIAPKPVNLPNLSDSTPAPNVTAKRKAPDEEQRQESSVKRSQMPDKATDKARDQADKNTVPNDNNLLDDQTTLPLDGPEVPLTGITAIESPVSRPHTDESNSVTEKQIVNQANDKPLVTGQSTIETQVSTEITRQLVDPKTTGSTSLLDSSRKPQSTGDTRLSMSESQPSPRQTVLGSTEPQEMQNLTPTTPIEVVKGGESAIKPSESTLKSTGSILGNDVSSPAVNTDLSTVQPDNAVTLPIHSHSNSYDAIKQELALIREESQAQRARTDQLLELLHNEALQRREAEKRLAEMSFEIQDQQMKIFRKDLEAKRSEALSMMYKAQAEMREASLIASEAREQRSKAMEESARAQVEIQILQKRIQDMELQYGCGSSVGIVSANIGDSAVATASSENDSQMGFNPVLTSANTISKLSANITTATTSGAAAAATTTTEGATATAITTAGVPPSTAAVAAAMAVAAVNAATSTRKQMTPESESSDREDPSAVKQARNQQSPGPCYREVM